MATKKQIKTEHFANLVAVAYSDGILTEDELQLLKEKALEYGLDEAAVNSIMENADKLEFIIPMNKEDREEQLSDAIYMMMIDGEINEKEYELCLRLAEKLDLNKKYLDHIIDLTKKLWANE